MARIKYDYVYMFELLLYLLKGLANSLEVWMMKNVLCKHMFTESKFKLNVYYLRMQNLSSVWPLYLLR